MITLNQFFQQIECEDKEVCLLGDVNCDLLTENPTCYTVKMCEIAVKYNLKQLITEATRITETSRTLIDHIYVSCHDKVTKSGVLKSGIISDHFIVYSILDKERKSVKHRHKYSVGRQYKNLDVNQFKSDLQNVDWRNVKKHKDINNAVNEFESIFLEIANRHAPIKRKRVRRRKSSPWLTEDILRAMRERDKLRSKACESNSSHLWSEFRNLKNKVNGMVKQAKKSFFTNALKNNKTRCT